MTRTERIKNWFQIGFQLLLVLAAVFALIAGHWLNFASAVFALFLTFLPSLIERSYKINLPSIFELVILVFLALSVYLGELQNFYDRFFWWDLFLHCLSGIILGAVGLELVNTLNKQKVSIKLSPGFVALFACTFAIALGVGWEIFEFGIDSFFGTNLQRSGLVDTMWDLIVDTIGAISISLLGYFYLKSDPKFIKKMEKLIFRL